MTDSALLDLMPKTHIANMMRILSSLFTKCIEDLEISDNIRNAISSLSSSVNLRSDINTALSLFANEHAADLPYAINLLPTMIYQVILIMLADERFKNTTDLRTKLILIFTHIPLTFEPQPIDSKSFTYDIGERSKFEIMRIDDTLLSFLSLSKLMEDGIINMTMVRDICNNNESADWITEELMKKLFGLSTYFESIIKNCDDTATITWNAFGKNETGTVDKILEVIPIYAARIVSINYTSDKYSKRAETIMTAFNWLRQYLLNIPHLNIGAVIKLAKLNRVTAPITDVKAFLRGEYKISTANFNMLYSRYTSELHQQVHRDIDEIQNYRRTLDSKDVLQIYISHNLASNNDNNMFTNALSTQHITSITEALDKDTKEARIIGLFNILGKYSTSRKAKEYISCLQYIPFINWSPWEKSITLKLQQSTTLLELMLKDLIMYKFMMRGKEYADTVRDKKTYAYAEAYCAVACVKIYFAKVISADVLLTLITNTCEITDVHNPHNHEWKKIYTLLTMISINSRIATIETLTEGINAISYCIINQQDADDAITCCDKSKTTDKTDLYPYDYAIRRLDSHIGLNVLMGNRYATLANNQDFIISQLKYDGFAAFIADNYVDPSVYQQVCGLVYLLGKCTKDMKYITDKYTDLLGKTASGLKVKHTKLNTLIKDTKSKLEGYKINGINMHARLYEHSEIYKKVYDVSCINENEKLSNVISKITDVSVSESTYDIMNAIGAAHNKCNANELKTIVRTVCAEYAAITKSKPSINNTDNYNIIYGLPDTILEHIDLIANNENKYNCGTEIIYTLLREPYIEFERICKKLSNVSRDKKVTTL